MEDEYPVSILQCLTSYSCTTLSFGVIPQALPTHTSKLPQCEV